MKGFSTGKQDISISTYNINTLNSYKLEVIIKYMQRTDIDIISLIDSRVDKDSVSHHSTQVKEILGQGSYVASNPVNPTQPTKDKACR